MKDTIKYNLDPVLYMHPADRAMLTKLDKMSIVANMLGSVSDFFCRQMEINIMGSGIRVTEKSLPSLYKNYCEVCNFFGVENPPLLYISHDPEVNAFAMGTDRAFIVVNGALLWRVNDAELKFLLGHELAHIMAGHMKYKQLLQILLSGRDYIPVVGKLLGKISDISLLPFLMLWSRRCEYTCDRAGMLVAPNCETAYSFFLKLSGLPPNYYEEANPQIIIRQAEEFQQLMSTGLMDTFWAAKNQLFSTHPRTIERAAEIKEWIDEGWYDEILNGDPDVHNKMAAILRSDPAEAEMRMLIIRIVIAWAMKRFNLTREAAAAPIRKAVYYNSTLRGTPVEAILQMEISISPLAGDRVEYDLMILYNDNGMGRKVKIKMPLPESIDFATKNIRETFIHNGYNPVVIQLYSVEDQA